MGFNYDIKNLVPNWALSVACEGILSNYIKQHIKFKNKCVIQSQYEMKNKISSWALLICSKGFSSEILD